MKVKRSQVTEIIKEEIFNHLRELLEAPLVDGDDDNGKKEKQKKQNPDDKVPHAKEPAHASATSTGGAKDDQPVKGPKAPGTTPGDAKDDEKGIGDAGKASKDVPPEKDLAADDAINKGIGEQIAGQTVMSLTTNSSSKYVPNGIELTIEFKDSPYPLRVLIPSKDVKYLYKNEVHSMLDAPKEPTR